MSLEQYYEKHLGVGGAMPPPLTDTNMQPSALTGHQWEGAARQNPNPPPEQSADIEMGTPEYIALESGMFCIAGITGVFEKDRLTKIRKQVLEEVALHLGHQLEDWKKKNGLPVHSRAVLPDKRGD